MKKIYISISLLSVYGDLLKRYLPANTALIVLYFLTLFILYKMLCLKNGKIALQPVTPEAYLLITTIYFLILLYILQLLSGFNGSFFKALVHVLYICIPLLYIITIIRFCPEFDIIKLGNIFLLFMAPVNLVGFIQYSMDSGFLISTSFSDTGGIIKRNLDNLIEGKHTFMRLPSIFASADRYSAMGLMQLYFTLLLFLKSDHKTGANSLWILFNLTSSIVALLIAGARSRIILALLLLILQIPVYFKPVFSIMMKNLLSLLISLFLAFLTVFSMFFLMPDFPVIDYLKASVEEGILLRRIKETFSFLLFTEDVSFFGQGLGTIGEGGKPGELGVHSMWKESGLVWSLPMLFSFSAILLIMARKVLNGLIGKRREMALSCSFYILVLISGLLTGLTSCFELASGSLLMCSIGSTFKSSEIYKNHYKT